jgi:hypothetical protein
MNSCGKVPWKICYLEVMHLVFWLRNLDIESMTTNEISYLIKYWLIDRMRVSITRTSFVHPFCKVYYCNFALFLKKAEPDALFPKMVFRFIAVAAINGRRWPAG